jgi:acylaminoacyl-peptidase
MVNEHGDYGEDLDKITRTVLVVHNIVENKTRVIGAPEHFGACQCGFASRDVLVVQAVDLSGPRILGLRSYINREYRFFAVRLTEEDQLQWIRIGPADGIMLFPRIFQIDESRAKIVCGRFVDNFGGHAGPMHLCCLLLDLVKLEVTDYRETLESFCFDAFPSRPFIDSEKIVLTLERRCLLIPVLIELNSFQMTDLLDGEESAYVDDVRGVKALIRVSSLIETPRFSILDTDSKDRFDLSESTKFSEFTTKLVLTESMNDALLILAPGEEKKFIVSPHGGPRGMFSTYFSRLYGIFYLNGWSICLVNYRGSMGYPLSVMEELIGKVSELDESDVIEHIRGIRKEFKVSKLGIWGWSHGGFLATVIAGKHSSEVDFVVAGAPVVNFISSHFSCDIPDWGICETGLSKKADGIIEMDEAALLRMWSLSSVKLAKNVSVPVLILHGNCDRRVPVGQALEWFLALQRNDKKVRILIYDNCGHSMKMTDAWDDALISSVEFFEDPNGFIEKGSS